MLGNVDASVKRERGVGGERKGDTRNALRAKE